MKGGWGDISSFVAGFFNLILHPFFSMKLLLALTLGFFYVLPILAQAPEMPEEPAPLEDATMEPMPDITLPPEPPIPSGKGPN
jgi:hypothetical protein